MRTSFQRLLGAGVLPLVLLMAEATADPLPPDATYRPLPTVPFETVRKELA
jgi:hypothetical protein